VRGAAADQDSLVDLFNFIKVKHVTGGGIRGLVNMDDEMT
jgi:hypothetical protein